jgi:oligopeptide/dipeptide ABC transporter ATP-binding protein
MLEAAPKTLVELEDVVKHYPVRMEGMVGGRRQLRAVDGVSFSISEGEALGLVGESGCGKSTVAKLMMRLLTPTSGRVVFMGRDITDLGRRAMRPLRRHMQIVFQDPFASLNPGMKAGDIVAEPLVVHQGHRPEANEVRELLELVGLHRGDANKYPHEFSGGQRQRISIARALALRPKLLVLDEPVSALDVSIQAQIINLLIELKDSLGLAYLFIAHDLSVVRHVCERVAVMYLGKIVEWGDREEVFIHPSHPYTQALVSAVPVPEPSSRDNRSRILLTGDVPSPLDPPSACRFRTRCWRAQDRCATETPTLERRLAGSGQSACHFPELVGPSSLLP